MPGPTTPFSATSADLSADVSAYPQRDSGAVQASASTVVQERRALLRRTEHLVHDLQPLPAGVVIACVVRCRDELIRMGVRSGLAVASESMARARLIEEHGALLQSVNF
ncbi:MAG TPA: hypothetical protein VFX41_05250 [Actinomycetales bacterium]|jgi:hypothetical protein|nr:hypothetical protein [Actinomycetales bacterium]